MFDKPLDVAHLTTDQRRQLDDLYAVRAEMAMRSIEANELKRKVVRDPSEENQAKLEAYLDDFIRPLARRLDDIQRPLKEDLLDKDKVMDMLPMILTLVNQVFDIRMFIELTGIDIASGHPIVRWIEELMNSDIPPG